ncbi:DUF305 domain-containing protein [Afipia sp. 1NLS2]|uniref:DUF305 domain-containing protein n=1 Tax=Afipia sp. 1NLS2 TaxID=666684 RepID=UPI001FDA5628|nr:DUF305 domain-containing protein [Afipia sp. 1NLS2]
MFARAEQPSTNPAPSSTKYPEEVPFLTENNTAMDKMMAGMSVEPTGDVDADFAAMMIPHHQGAIDMAIAELRYGKNEQLRRIAQEIIVEQQQEIAAMNLAIGKPLPPSSAVPTQVSIDEPPITSGTASKGSPPNPHNNMSMSPMNHMKNPK